MTGEVKRSALDALHAELLVDVQTLVGAVATLKTELPAKLADIEASAEAVKASAKAATEEFQAMGHALVGVMRREIEAEREASALASRNAASTTKKALEQFTKNFWLLSGLTAANFLLGLAMVIRG